uniref:Uncharacterized protein n=1 Tax=Anguilla anguilla TaxID=7936 RepID=A0A0E9P8E2_ANGAN
MVAFNFISQSLGRMLIEYRPLFLQSGMVVAIIA